VTFAMMPVDALSVTRPAMEPVGTCANAALVATNEARAMLRKTTQQRRMVSYLIR
jgi:hypothetical protein